MPDASSPEPPIDTGVPHNARIWNYWLGGKDNYAVDREMGESIREFFPEIVENARADRAFLVRAVRYLARDVGINQFLDIGTGLPTHNNTHEVAQSVAPDSRVVYVDNDPMVLTHARALLVGSPEGATDYIDADLCEPERILDTAAQTLDFSRPVGLMLLGVVNFVADDDEAHRVLDRLIEALAPGSCLVVSHPTAVLNPERALEVQSAWNERGTPKLTLRTPEEITALFRGLEPVEPGVVSCSHWHPHPPQVGDVRPVDEYGGVAVKR